MAVQTRPVRGSSAVRSVRDQAGVFPTEKRVTTIQNILDRKGVDVITIGATDTVRSAADRTREHGVAALVVKTGDAVKGLVSERDIVQAISRHDERALALAVSHVVTHAMVTVAPTDSLKRAMSLMTNHRLRHLPVVTDGKLVGIVSIGDVVKHRLEDLETETNVLRDAYIAARQKSRGKPKPPRTTTGGHEVENYHWR
jgi:CBS domain-containing protein